MHTLDPTLSPQETIRSDAQAPVTQPALPLLSVDLRQLEPDPNRRSDLEVRGLIGEGGMGRVLLARQHSLERDVAVKTSRTEAANAAILLEGSVTGSLEHPGIVPVHALGLDARGQPVMVMKRIEGVSWDALLAEPKHPLWEGWEGSAEDRLPGHLQILMQVCNAVHFAHSRGVVHRDLKPANVLIGGFGDAYVADWGLGTKVGTRTPELCGTPAFFAPEMVSGGSVDARTDVYLLGAVLHVLLTGKPRHEGSSISEVVLVARESRAFTYPANVAPELAELANRACHVDPSQRPTTAREFREALGEYLRHRDARALTEQAQRRVVELEPLLALDAPSADQQAKVERLLSEARFGLEQALAQWPENDGARGSLQKVEQMLEARRVRLAALEQEARERDPRRGWVPRTVGLAGTTVLGTVAAMVSAFTVHPGDGLRDDGSMQWQVISFPAVVAGLMVVGAFVMRKRLLETRLHQQTFALMMGAMISMTALRVFALWSPQPVWAQLSRDAAATAAFTAAAALGYLRWLWPTAVAFFVTAVVCATWKGEAVQVFAGGTAATMAVTTVMSWWDGRKKAHFS